MGVVNQIQKAGGAECRIGADIGKSINAAGYGIPLGGTPDANGAVRTAAFRVGADDNGAALTAGEYRGALSRTLITYAQSNNVTISGQMGQLKVTGVTLAGAGNKAGVCGYLELSSAATIDGDAIAAGVWGRVDCPSGCTIASGQILAGVAVGGNDLGGTHTGKAAAFAVATPFAGTWDSALEVSSTSGCYSTSAGSAATKYITVSVDGTPYKISLLAVS